MIFPLKPIFSKVIPFSDPNLSRSKSLISATTVPVRLSQPRCPHGSRPPSHLGRPQELEKSEGSGSNSQNCVHYKHIMISKLHIYVYIYICMNIYIYIMYYGLYVFKYHIFSVYTYVHISMCVYIYMVPPKKTYADFNFTGIYSEFYIF